MSNWEEEFIAKAATVRETVMSQLATVPPVYPSGLEDYWANVKGMILRMLVTETDRAAQEVRESGTPRDQAFAWLNGVIFAANLVAESTLDHDSGPPPGLSL